MDAADLYGLPRDEFISARGELAKALRAEGRRDEAAAVAGRRKPSVAAWVVNQLVRARQREFAELCAAGDDMRDAQSALLAGGGDRDALRAAAERERALVAQLVETAGGLLGPTGAGPGAAVLDRVADTLHAAALDDAARVQVGVGVLARELRHIGLGGELVAVPLRKPTAGAPAKRAAAGPDRQVERARLAQQRAETERRERERAEARRAARMAESTARRELERTDRAARRAHDLRETAAQALAAAEAELTRTRDEAAAAAAVHRRATAELERT